MLRNSDWLLVLGLSLAVVSATTRADVASVQAWREAMEAVGYPETAAARRDSLLAAQAALRIAERLGPAHASEVGQTLTRIAFLQQESGDHEATRRTQERIIEVSVRAHGAASVDVAFAWSDLATTLARLGKPVEAEEGFRRACETCDKHGTPDWRCEQVFMAYAKFAASRGNVQEARLLFGRAGMWVPVEAMAGAGRSSMVLEAIAQFELTQGNSANAEVIHRNHLKSLQARGQADTFGEGHASYELAKSLATQGRDKEAAELFTKAIANYELSYGPMFSDLAVALFERAKVLERAGELDRAAVDLDRAIAIETHSYGAEHKRLTPPLEVAARVEKARGNRDMELALRARLIPLLAKHYGTEHRRLSTQLNLVGNAQLALGRNAEAERNYAKAIAILDRADARGSSDLAIVTTNRARAMRLLGQSGKALELAERSLKMREASVGADHAGLAPALIEVARSQKALGRPQEALPQAERAVELLSRQTDPDPTSLSSALDLVGSLARASRQFDKAERAYLEAITIREKAFGKDSETVANSTSNLAFLYRVSGKGDKALELNRKALSIHEAHPQRDPAGHSMTCNNLGSLLRDRGEYVEAERRLTQAISIREGLWGPEHILVAQSLNNLAILYRLRRDYPGSGKAFSRALGIRERSLGRAHEDTLATLRGIALLRGAQEQWPAAEAVHIDILTRSQAVHGPRSGKAVDAALSLATFQVERRAYGRAHETLANTLQVTGTQVGVLASRALRVLDALTHVRIELGRLQDAIDSGQRALALAEAIHGKDARELVPSLAVLAYLYRQTEQHSKAAMVKDRIEKILGRTPPPSV